MANQVEWVKFLAQFGSDQVNRETLVLQFLKNGLFSLSGIPALEKVVEAGKMFSQSFLSEVAQRLGDEPAALVQIFHPLGDYRCPYSVHVHFTWPAARRQQDT